MATSKKEITVIPEATKLSDSILNLPTPPLSVKKTMEKDYMEMIDAAFNVHKNSQILTVLMVGYCIKKLDILHEKAGKGIEQRTIEMDSKKIIICQRNRQVTIRIFTTILQKITIR